MELYKAIEKYSRQAGSVAKHFRAAGIVSWADLNTMGLHDIKDEIDSTLAPNTTKTMYSIICTFLDIFANDMGVRTDYRGILRAKGTDVVKTWLTPAELKQLEKVVVKSRKEAVVLHQFLIGAYTGMRLSDINNVTDENVTDGILTYVSVKTGVASSVPVSQRILDYIHDTQGEGVSRARYNDIIQRLCMRANINEVIKIYKAGKAQKGPKWMFVTSHTARISFCTNLSSAGVPLMQLSRLAGHTNTAMTERYVARNKVTLSKAALNYLVQE